MQARYGSKYFAKIDAKSAFFQLPLAEESRNVTSFVTPRGFFRSKSTSFDLGDASGDFQKMMEEILFGIRISNKKYETLEARTHKRRTHRHQRRRK